MRYAAGNLFADRSSVTFGIVRRLLHQRPVE